MSSEKHVYDGIVEENNPMPDWWIWLFIFTVIFGFIYWLHYASGGGATLADEYAKDLAAYQENLEKQNSAAVTETEETLTAYMGRESSVAAGAALFAEKCAMCHAPDLGGKVGPNLTDAYWIHGNGSRADILQVISEGVPAKGMPPWGTMLKRSELKNVAAFVFSKIGSKPAEAKAPEGKKIR